LNEVCSCHVLIFFYTELFLIKKIISLDFVWNMDCSWRVSMYIKVGLQLLL
jgi:hypothetical protein